MATFNPEQTIPEQTNPEKTNPEQTNPTPLKNLKNLKNLVLSGGGLLGISYIGLLKYLEECNIISQIKTITGSSAGAIFGTFFAIGYKSKELEKQVKTIVFKDYMKINAESLLNFPRNKGFESGRLLMEYIKDRIRDKTNNPDITFSQLYEQFQITLQIGSTNLTQYKFEIFNHINTPNIPVYLAIRASIAIPFVFEPIIINGNLYCDGGLIENLPIEYIENLSTNELNLDNKSPLETLGVCLINNIIELNSENIKNATLSHYFSVIMKTLSMTYYHKKCDIDNTGRNKILLFEIPCDLMTFIKINATHEDIDNIIEIAYNICKKELPLNK